MSANDPKLSLRNLTAPALWTGPRPLFAAVDLFNWVCPVGRRRFRANRRGRLLAAAARMP
jgi:hypothetical protein